MGKPLVKGGGALYKCKGLFLLLEIIKQSLSESLNNSVFAYDYRHVVTQASRYIDRVQAPVFKFNWDSFPCHF